MFVLLKTVLEISLTDLVPFKDGVGKENVFLSLAQRGNKYRQTTEYIRIALSF